MNRNLSPCLRLLKEIARPVDLKSGKDALERIKSDVLSGLRVGFFIRGEPVVASLADDGKTIVVNPLNAEGKT